MTVTPEGARGAFVAMVLAGAPLHPDAVTLGLRLTDRQLAGALALAAELTVRRPGESFSIRQRVPKTRVRMSAVETGPAESADELYLDLDAASTAIIVTALVAEME